MHHIGALAYLMVLFEKIHSNTCKDLVCPKSLTPPTSQEETDDSTNRMEYTDSEAETEDDCDEPKPKGELVTNAAMW